MRKKFWLKGKYKRFQWKCSEGRSVILEQFSSPAPWDALSFTLKNVSCIDHSQRVFGFLLGTVTFLLLLGKTNSQDGRRRISMVLLRLMDPRGLNLRSWNFTDCRAQALALTVNEISCFNWGYEGQFQSHRAFIKSTCLSAAQSRALHARVAFSFPGTTSLSAFRHMCLSLEFLLLPASSTRTAEQHLCVSNK